MTELAIKTLNLTKKFKSTTALKALNFEVQEGDVVSILGPNGAGKTTLLKILSTLVYPDEGQAKIFGHDIREDPDRAKQKLSLMIGEERSFYWRLSGRQNLAFFATLYNLNAEEAAQKIKEAAAIFDLPHLDKPYQTYSTGNKSRLALARAYLHNAPLLLMDEPTRSLDPLAAAHFQALVLETFKAKKKTVVFTTHQIEEAETLSDKIAVLVEGSLQFFDSRDAFQTLRKRKNIHELFQKSKTPL